MPESTSPASVGMRSRPVSRILESNQKRKIHEPNKVYDAQYYEAAMH